MSTFLHNSLLIAPILLAVSLIDAQGASAIPADMQTTQFQAKEGVVAQTDNQAVLTAPIGVTSSDQSQQFNDDSNKSPNSVMSQVTSVSQLSDVQPTDWAFQALQSLVERYGCIAGYPNGSFQGNRAILLPFDAHLCLQSVLGRLIAVMWRFLDLVMIVASCFIFYDALTYFFLSAPVF